MDFGIIFRAIFRNLVDSSLFNFVSFMFLKYTVLIPDTAEVCHVLKVRPCCATKFSTMIVPFEPW